MNDRLFVYLVLIVIFVLQTNTIEITLDYHHQYLWPLICRNGHRQSPININISESISCPGNSSMYFNQTNAKFYLRHFQNSQDLKNPFDNQTFIHYTQNGITKIFNSYAFHWHTPSEHTINGKQYALELHMVHKNIDGTIAVAGILFEVDYTHKTKNIFDSVNFVQSQGEIIDFPFKFTGKPYYHYKGSLTTPPCSQVVDWFIRTEVEKISLFQLKKIISSKNFGKINNRKIQPIFNRKVSILSDKCINNQNL